MITFELAKAIRRKTDCLVARLSVFNDLFGVWTCEWLTYRDGRRILRQVQYFDAEAMAMTWVEDARRRLLGAGWVNRDETKSLPHDVFDDPATMTGLLAQARVSASALEYEIARGAVPMRADLKAMVEVLGLAFRQKTNQNDSGDATQLDLALETNCSIDDHVRQRATVLFAGLLSYSLDGNRAALEVAQRSHRGPVDESAYVRLIPKSRHAFLHQPLDGFVHPDRRLVRAALKMMTQGIWTVGDLVRLNEAAVLALLGGNLADLTRLKTCLSEQGLALNAAFPTRKLVGAR